MVKETSAGMLLPDRRRNGTKTIAEALTWWTPPGGYGHSAYVHKEDGVYELEPSHKAHMRVLAAVFASYGYDLE